MGLLVEPTDGFEPSTCGLRNRCSTTELRWLVLTPAGGGLACRFYRRRVFGTPALPQRQGHGDSRQEVSSCR